jgi:hypothetical protein
MCWAPLQAVRSWVVADAMAATLLFVMIIVLKIQPKAILANSLMGLIRHPARSDVNKNSRRFIGFYFNAIYGRIDRRTEIVTYLLLLRTH